ncbi:carboxylesterase/lipase family protein [Naasia sp. SYSU D00948]|uniref:carboxylesterase/lipase family protein n=1 Tax=Naasia sp. SYSU D00948 TaxID=2817379 RepID=UPI001B30B35C|nr:carboxylesterase family protein [Naasia sp. SYSU D00948]
MTTDAGAQYPIVETTAGAVRGFRRGDSDVFLGIPYAEVPFGERRFLAPEPRARWSGVRDALEYGPTPQRKALAEVTAIPEPSIPGEDILSVNVFTPSARPADGSGLPVLVYIHGGGYVAGSPASPWYDGAAFNRDGVVLVVISYRLGFEGFGWLPDAPANRGILDWILALEWVRDNIGTFGGDPAQVTIAGQSAGGGAVMTLLTLPGARGLFSRVAALSPAPADITLAVAELATTTLAERLGIEGDRAGFASVPEAELLNAIGGGFSPLERPTAESLIAASRGMGGLITFGPVVDGDLVPAPIGESVRAGAGADIPLLIGSTRDEFSGLALGHRSLFDSWEPEELLRQLGLDAATAAAYVGSLNGDHAAEALGQYTTDLVFRRHTRAWADARRGPAPTWVYDFAWPSGIGGISGHCLDVPFVFDVLAHPHVATIAGADAPQSLADTVHGAYAAFIRDGLPGWQAYDEAGAVMVWDAQPHVETGTYDSAQVLVGS